MTERRFDCLCVGIIVADHLCAPIGHLPAAGELVTTERLELTIGGCASNVAVDLAKLGTKAGVVGIVGNDVFGRYVKESLEEAGVSCDHVVDSETKQTSGTLIVNVCGEDRRFIHAVGANADFDGTQVTPELIQSCRILYLGGYCLSDNPSAENVAAIFQMAQAAGVITVLDVVIPEPADYWPRLKPVLPFTDVFLPNNDEAQAITGHTDPVEQARAFQAAGAKTVLVTCGGDGTVLVSDEAELRSGIDRVEFVDGTGSGDAFAAGYIYGLLRDASQRECLRYGSALGASSVCATGATNGVFSAEQLHEFVQSHELAIDSI